MAFLRCLLNWLTPVPGKGCDNQCCIVVHNRRKIHPKVGAVHAIVRTRRLSSFRLLEEAKAQSDGELGASPKNLQPKNETEHSCVEMGEHVFSPVNNNAVDNPEVNTDENGEFDGKVRLPPLDISKK